MPLELDSESHLAILDQVADFTLRIDGKGRIAHLAVANEELNGSFTRQWKKKQWLDTTDANGRERLQQLLDAAAAAPGQSVLGDVIHQLPDGSEMPVQYRAVQPSGSDMVLAFGHDLRATANLRQQLVNAQQALEQDYWRLRQVETRYRGLFDMVQEAVMVVDGATGRILEANAAASDLLAGGKPVVGKPLHHGLDARSVASVDNMLEETRTAGKGSLSGIRVEETGQRLNLSASFVRQAGETRFLVRMAGEGDRESTGGGERFMQEALRLAPDGVLLTDPEGRVLAANRAFLELAQLASEEPALGHSADRWLGRSGVDLSVLLTNLREHDVVRLFATTLRGESGTHTEVEISACSLNDLHQPMMAFFIRDIGRRLGVEHPMVQQLPRSIDQVTQRVGRVPLKELVRESRDVIEALCIEAALELTHDNRASAAELLGLSRQSLYAKMRRYGIFGDDSAAENGQE